MATLTAIRGVDGRKATATQTLITTVFVTLSCKV
jgi:hypothetical protein